jgi:hypothetical protein
MSTESAMLHDSTTDDEKWLHDSVLFAEALFFRAT